jgi:hypothetical protein
VQPKRAHGLRTDRLIELFGFQVGNEVRRFFALQDPHLQESFQRTLPKCGDDVIPSHRLPRMWHDPSTAFTRTQTFL